MEQKYKIIALFGKSGVGKDTLQKYLIKKIPTGRMPNKQKINSLNCHKGSKAIKFVKDNCWN